jgi:hypothetical protein
MTTEDTEEHRETYLKPATRQKVPTTYEIIRL